MDTYTLLLVDDSITIEHEIRSALAGEPIQIAVAVNGHRALDRIEADRPAVVLASTTAFGVNGYGLAHYVSQRPDLRNVAVLLLAGTIGPVDEHRMRESGARGFVHHPIEPAIVLERVREVLMRPAPAIEDADVFGPLTTAFDAIDASMTGRSFGGKTRPTEIANTPDALAKMVNEAVTQAIAAYEQERGLAPGHARGSTIGWGQHPPVDSPSLELRKRQQLQQDMGLEDIASAWAPPTSPGAASVVANDLATQMGVDEFAFEEYESTRRTETSEPAAITFEPAVVEVLQAPARDAAGDFAFGLEDLPRWEVAPDAFATPPSVASETNRHDEATDATTVQAPLRNAIGLLGTALADRANRFRSALARRARPRTEERAEAVLAAAPAAPTVPAPAPAEVPAPAEPVPSPTVSRPSLPRLEATTREDASWSVFFTFDPIPPVPPPAPREPRED